MHAVCHETHVSRETAVWHETPQERQQSFKSSKGNSQSANTTNYPTVS